MLEPLSLEEAKKHLRVEFTDDDALISALIIAAREYAEGFLNKPLATKEEDPPVPQKWKQAMLLLVGAWYANRESGGIPAAVDALLWQDRKIPIA